MATAPRPTVAPRANLEARRKVERQIFAFTIGDAVYRIAPFNVAIADKALVQAQVGLTWEEVLGPLVEGRLSSASLAVIVWLARRRAGEPRLRWSQFTDEWDDEALGDSVQLVVEDPEDVGDTPEASGPA